MMLINDSLFKRLFHVGLVRQRLLYAKLIKTEFSDCDLILDVGCGAGIFIGACKRFGKFVVGVDVDRQQLPKAKNKKKVIVKGF